MIQTSDPITTALLFLLLLAAFIIAFKVLEMIMETFLVSALSAGFYLAFTYLFYGTMPGLEQLLLFAFAGASLYMGYTVLASAYVIASKIIGVPYTVLKEMYHAIEEGLETLHQKMVEKKDERKEQKKQKDSKSNREDDNVKEVVLNNTKED